VLPENALARRIPRDLHEGARDVARAHAATPQYVEGCPRRKKVEMLFAHPEEGGIQIPRGSCASLRSAGIASSKPDNQTMELQAQLSRSRPEPKIFCFTPLFPSKVCPSKISRR
jgi:hypothetical protein